MTTKINYNQIKGAPVSVLDYGADKTGAADSTTAFNSALAFNSGGQVFVPDGTYLITGAVTITGQLVGGRGAILSLSSAAKFVLRISDSSLIGMSFNVTGVLSASLIVHGFNGAARCTIQGNYFYGANIASTNIIACDQTGLDDWVIDSNVATAGVYGVLFNENATGINCKITNNVFKAMNGGVNLNPATSKAFTNVLIEGNTLVVTAGEGFGVSLADALDVTIVDNDISASINGVHIEGASKRVIVSNNRIDCSVAAGAYGVLIGVGGFNIIISNNTIKANNTVAGSGIYTVNTSGLITGLTINANQIVGTGGGYWGVGLDLQAQNSDMVVIGNTVFAVLGCACSYVTDGEIADNTFDSCTTVYSTALSTEFGRTNLTGTLPTTVSVCSSGANTVRGIFARFSYAHAASGATVTTQVIKIPTLYLGDSHLRIGFNGENYGQLLTNARITGGVWTDITQVSAVAGVIGAPAITVSGTYILVGCSAAGGASTAFGVLELNGSYII